MLTTVLPAGRGTGGEVVTDTFLRAIRDAGHRVTVIGYTRPREDQPHEDGVVAVAERPIETADAPRVEIARWALTALFRRLPYSVAKYRSSAYRRAAVHAAASADVVVIDHGQAGWLLDELPALPTLAFLAHNVEHRLYGEQAALTVRARAWVNRREQRLMRAIEHRVVTRAAETWTLTADDARSFQEMVPAARVRVFAMPGRGALLPPSSRRTTDVALLGTWSWAANAAGLRWFCEQVLPLLDPTCRIEVAGAGGEWSAADPRVTYRGRVADAGTFLSTARVVAIPSTAGSGVQVKTLDALASGAWVVATQVAVRGIEGADEVAEIANSPVAFAEAITRLLDDERTLGPCHAALEWSVPRDREFRATVAAALDAVKAPSA